MGRTTTAIWFAIAAPFALVFLIAAQNDTPGLDPRSGQALGSPSDPSDGRSGPVGNGFVYTVQLGDTLDGIANLFAVERVTLVEANDIDQVHDLLAGTRLVIPLEPNPDRPDGIGLLATEMMLRDAETAFDLPRGLLLAVAWQESHWQQSAVSASGAIGIGQLLPTTARWIEETLVEEPLDWESSTRDNAHAAAAYLAYLLERSDGDVWMALAGYYQGAHSVDTQGAGTTTPAYVEGVLRLVPRYQ
jgi:hypothetical protein